MLQQPQCLELGQAPFAFIAQHMTAATGPTFMARRQIAAGLASDYARIRAAFAFHEATGAREYLAAALAWQAALDRHYAHEANGGYYLTANDAEGLVVRPDSTIDEAIPNASGLAAQNLTRLAILSGDDIWRERADILRRRAADRSRKRVLTQPLHHASGSSGCVLHETWKISKAGQSRGGAAMPFPRPEAARVEKKSCRRGGPRASVARSGQKPPPLFAQECVLCRCELSVMDVLTRAGHSPRV
jgi:uncharacterized protein YyaL (SSP411 family)